MSSYHVTGLLLLLLYSYQRSGVFFILYKRQKKPASRRCFSYFLEENYRAIIYKKTLQRDFHGACYSSEKPSRVNLWMISVQLIKDNHNTGKKPIQLPNCNQYHHIIARDEQQQHNNHSSYFLGEGWAEEEKSASCLWSPWCGGVPPQQQVTKNKNTSAPLCCTLYCLCRINHWGKSYPHSRS